MSKLNEIIRDKIAERGLKKVYVAEKVGISQDALTGIIQGRRKMRADEFIAFCDVLGIDMAEVREKLT